MSDLPPPPPPPSSLPPPPPPPGTPRVKLPPRAGLFDDENPLFTGRLPVTPQHSARYASFGLRVRARMIDSAILAVVSIPLWFLLATNFASDVESCGFADEQSQCDVSPLSSAGVVLGVIVTLFAVMAVYNVWFVSRSGQTPGRKAVGIAVVDQHGRPIGLGKASVRYVMTFVSGSACYLGYLWVLWDAKNQTWHDKMVGSYVVRVRGYGR